MSQKLAGSTAIITGASAGIGRASALALAGEGANIVLTARREERLTELVQAIQTAGGQAAIVIGDAREEETARQTVQVAQEKFGTVNILVNNVGVGNYKPLIETSAEDYDEVSNPWLKPRGLRLVSPTDQTQAQAYVTSEIGTFGYFPA